MTNATLLKTKVSQVMTEDLLTVKGNESLNSVKKIFDTQNINHIPVVGDEGKLIGIISRKDFLLLLDWGTKLGLKSSEIKNKYLLDSNTATDLMTSNMVTVKPEDTLARCAEILLRNKFHALPVVEGGTLVGLITTFDMLVEAYIDSPRS